MKGHLIIIVHLALALFLVGCSGNGVTNPPVVDTAPPAWDKTVGVVNVVPGEISVTVEWGTASGSGTSPVEYLVYIDEDDDPWDTVPVVKGNNDPHLFTNLVYGIQYWCGVRCRDSVDPQNVDSNSVVISATPRSLDTTAPEWDEVAGLISVSQGIGSVTVKYGSAVDAENSPVEYLLYSDIDDDPWDQEPLVLTTNDPYTFLNLDSYIDYYFGVRCRDSANIPNYADSDYVLVSQTIPGGWAVDWQHGNFANAEIQTDNRGNIYIFGEKQGAVDIDPTDEINFFGGTDAWDVFILQVKSDGEYQWAFQWLGSSMVPYNARKFGFCIDSNNEIAMGFRYNSINHLQKIDRSAYLIWELELETEFNDIIVDGNGDLYILGGFTGSPDFDPGIISVIHTSNGGSDAYLSKFDSSGTFLWVRVFSGTNEEIPHKLVNDSNGNIYLIGDFYETVDFDPGPGTDYYTSNGSSDIFLCSLNTDGLYRWTRTWGGSGEDRGYSITANNPGNVYVSGTFENNVDFDPGPGEDIRNSGEGEWYLSRYDADGSYQIAYIADQVIIPAFDGTGNLYCTGNFTSDVDLDLTGSGDIHNNNETDNSYLSLYGSTGEYLWSTVWGGTDGAVHASNLTFDNEGNVYVVGLFSGNDCDFYPGSSIEIHPADQNSHSVLYLSKFTPEGNW